MWFTINDGSKVILSYSDMEMIHNAYLTARCEGVISDELKYVSNKPEQYTQRAKDELAERMVNDINSQINGDLMAMSFNDRVAEMDEEVGSLDYALKEAETIQHDMVDPNVDPLDQIRETAEELGWNVEYHSQSDRNGGIDHYAEFSQYSPAGEDFSFAVFYDDAEDLVNRVSEYSYEFDIDEHAEMWVGSAGKNGVPSISALVEDANDIKDMLEELSDGLSGIDLNLDYEEEVDRDDEAR